MLNEVREVYCLIRQIKSILIESEFGDNSKEDSAKERGNFLNIVSLA